MRKKCHFENFNFFKSRRRGPEIKVIQIYKKENKLC